MTKEDHKKRHEQLHKALDELFADYVSHHPHESIFTQMPLINLLSWSNEQQQNPTPQNGEHE